MGMTVRCPVVLASAHRTPLSKALGELLLRLRIETDQWVATETRLESVAESESVDSRST